jgi:GNAT superfamily N-acetyltransferase
MRIEYLADHPEVLPVLARWHHEQFGYLNPGGSLTRVEAHLRTHTGRRQVPTTVVALRGEEPLGSASLVASDMETRPEAGPWLASVYVAAPYREQGIGSALVKRIEAEAEALGFGAIYLYTPDKAAFYRRRGWSILDREHYRGTDVVVMTKAVAKQLVAADAA